MTDSYPEPTNVGPIAGGNLRASDTDRDQVVTLLSTAYAEGRLTKDEHDERLTRAMSARTFDELIPITHDLVAIHAPSAVPAEVHNTNFTIDTTRPSQGADQMIAVFSGVERKGKWRIRKNSNCYALFGGVDLDLREATFEAPVVEIAGAWIFGGLEIKVPEGIEVRDQTVGIFGGSDVSHVGDPQPGAPVLVVKGLALFGGVSVKGPKPPRRRRRR